MPSRKNWERSLRKDFIARKAGELFARSSYDATTVEDIARHAEFGKGTIYQYFSSKLEILSYLLEKSLIELQKELEIIAQNYPQPTGEEIITALENVIEAYYSYLERHAHLLNALKNQPGTPEKSKIIRAVHQQHDSIFRLWLPLVEQGIKEGKLVNADPMDLALAIINVVRGFGLRRFFAPTNGNAESNSETATEKPSSENEKALAMLRHIIFYGILEDSEKHLR